jgi:hypothetical protein
MYSSSADKYGRRHKEYTIEETQTHDVRYPVQRIELQTLIDNDYWMGVQLAKWKRLDEVYEGGTMPL